MILLLDANLSWRLTNLLKPYFDEVWHIESVDLQKPAIDIEIWEFARLHHTIIVTNDDDFYKLSILKGFPPKVVVLRIGNQSTQYIAQILIKHLQDISSFYESNEYGLLEIF
jgi:predicted nuclease of predicted toxin-antitoxin system